MSYSTAPGGGNQVATSIGTISSADDNENKAFALAKSYQYMDIAIKPKHAYISQIQVVAAAAVMSLTHNLPGSYEWISVSKRSRFLGWADLVNYSGI